MNDLKITLESLVARYNTMAFTENDPVLFPRRFLGKSKQDIEIAAFLASTITWGNRKQIMRGCQKMLFEIMGGKPYDFVMQGGWKHIDPNCNIHRTFFGRDLAYMCEGLRFAYWVGGSYDTLEYVFMERDYDVWAGFSLLRELFADANGKHSKHFPNPQGNSHKGGSACKRLNLMLRWLCRQDGIVDLGVWHNLTPDKLMIFPNPQGNSHKGGSACKRLNLMLRWLCRQDGIVDLGVWHNLTPDKLMIPLDVHVARIGRELGLITRKSNDRKTVEELTQRLADFDPKDPCKYDFALFGYGEQQKRIAL